MCYTRLWNSTASYTALTFSSQKPTFTALLSFLYCPSERGLQREAPSGGGQFLACSDATYSTCMGALSYTK